MVSDGEGVGEEELIVPEVNVLVVDGREDETDDDDRVAVEC